MAPKPTSDILRQVRKLMRDTTVTSGHVLSCYIVPSRDSHDSEYICDADKRRGFVTGFDGSAGTALITHRHALLWTDGRYYSQASKQMDDNWTLVKEGEPGAQTRSQWMEANLNAGDEVGFDPFLMSYNEYNTLKAGLDGAGIKLVPVERNLIDIVWGSDRPQRPDNPVYVQDVAFAGESWQEKVQRVRLAMKENSSELLLLSALDEVAWLLNLRGSDIPNNPVFFSYVTITESQVQLFVSESQLDDGAKKQLRPTNGERVEIKPYEAIQSAFSELLNSCRKVWLSKDCSQALSGLVGIKREENMLKTVFSVTPPTLMKAIKNETELQGFEQSHIRDGAALCCYIAWLEKNVGKTNVTELSGAQKLLEFRMQMAHFVQVSFDTISSSGPNSSVIHYRPTEETDRPITKDEMYLVDSGAQYKDGTTDVTRTIHLGCPTDWQKKCFTRVFKAQTQLNMSRFPDRTVGSRLDVLARRCLWDAGLDYKHGTGHGVGHFLNVHEGPMGISWRAYPEDPGLQQGMVLSNEPGYYEDGSFGIRIENLVKVVKSEGFDGFLTFENLTMVPIQRKMIVSDLLTKSELDYLNEYHETCREKVGPILREMGLMDGLNYLMRETKPLG